MLTGLNMYFCAALYHAHYLKILKGRKLKKQASDLSSMLNLCRTLLIRMLLLNTSPSSPKSFSQIIFFPFLILGRQTLHTLISHIQHTKTILLLSAKRWLLKLGREMMQRLWSWYFQRSLFYRNIAPCRRMEICQPVSRACYYFVHQCVKW